MGDRDSNPQTDAAAPRSGARLTPRDWRHLFVPGSPLPFAKEFRKLQEVARQRPDYYNQPDASPPNQPELYDLFLQANLINVAREMARVWGEDDSDGPLRGFERLRCWPDAEMRGPHTLRLSFGLLKPTNIFRDLARETNEQIEIHDHNNRLVFCTEGHYIRPGDWITALMSEYHRFRLWRHDCEEQPGLPKPLRPLPPHLSIPKP
jgi:hypothetical protein